MMNGLPGLPGSIVIALWVVGSCWAVVLVAYLFDVADGLVFPLVIFGVATGIAEYMKRGRGR
jgi:hypothetical protein